MKARLGLAFAGCLLAVNAHASCGAAFCSTSNDWLSITQGAAQGWRVWGQLEYLKMDQLRHGSDKVSPGTVAADHEEIKTLNRNALLGLDYGFAPGWSAGLMLPYSNREHVHQAAGAPDLEAWQFDNIGDMRMTLRYQPPVRTAGGLTGSLQGGLKLPTGRTDVRNAAGEVAERSVQPGSGTTDLLLGGGLAYSPLTMPGSLFANLSLQAPLDARDGYQPGWRTSVQAGWLLPVHGRLDLILQGNALYVNHDRGVNAEPADSGHTEVAFVPGLAYAWSRNLSVYGQVELPLYQRVNGLQLTHAYAMSVGFSLALN
ncbi:hypothetical protein [Thiobacillus sedimenti]|uniref:Transporter n=1 Tax=Thiobacillus sedimenti TaxID=3110231 RepID=A0ABZ1CPW4_9PROT|nr:hypothetical protein [Thiobacillus sp. SCUT-2]WRS39978.1 hypothetical protein VA613_03660 [Thiobacillus sp. SCUT-2]